jgi:chemotaxis protein MotB
LRQELATTRTALSTAQEQLRKAAAEAETARQQLAGANAALAQAQKTLQEQHAAQAAQAEEIGKLQHALTAQQGEVKTLRQELDTTRASLTTTQQNAQQAQQTLTTIRQQLQEAQSERAQWQERHTATERTLTTVRNELQQTTATAESLRQRLQANEARQAQAASRLQTLHTQLAQGLKEAIERQEVTLQQGAQQVRVQIEHAALFLQGQMTALRNTSQSTLDHLATILQTVPDHTVWVEGHTDSVPLNEAFRRRWPTNWELSAARAASVARYLEGQGIASQRLTVAGHAASRPLADNDTEAGRAQNRRIEIRVQLPD